MKSHRLSAQLCRRHPWSRTTAGLLRNVRRDTSIPPKRPRKPADEQGFRPLFDGKTLKGWHTNAEKIFHGTGGKVAS
jgi:hypothetical protein